MGAFTRTLNTVYYSQRRNRQTASTSTTPSLFVLGGGVALVVVGVGGVGHPAGPLGAFRSTANDIFQDEVSL